MYGKMSVVLLVLALALGCESFGGTAATKAGTDPAGKTGVLLLTVNARNAKVIVDGALYGMIKKAGKPQSFVIPAGAHNLTLKKFGYKEQSVKIGLEAGAINTLEVKLQRLPSEVVRMPGDKPGPRPKTPKK